MRNVNEKIKFYNNKRGKCDKCVLGTFYEVFGESPWSVYEYSKSLKVYSHKLA